MNFNNYINSTNRHKFVIDASISNSNEVLKFIYDICMFSDKKIIITSITLRELDSLQKNVNTAGRIASTILAMAAENDVNFEIVQINEGIGIPDDCIIEYCRRNRAEVMLITADKVMALKARMYNIETKFIKRDIINTLYFSYVKDKKLILTNPDCKRRLCIVISDEIEYNINSPSIKKELKIGDDILICISKSNYIILIHYKVISLYADDNVRLIYSKRIYRKSEIDYLYLAMYKSIVREYNSIHNIIKT